MRFLLGFVTGVVAIVALSRTAHRSRRVVRGTLRNDAPALPAMSRNLARYYRVSLN